MASRYSAVIEPISEEQQQEVVDLTHEYVELASDYYNRRFRKPHIEFNVYGYTAGMFWLKGNKPLIRYNPWLFAKYYDDNLALTVPHEVAHFVVDRLYGNRYVKPHGEEWQEIMALFDADPSVTCDFDFSGIPQRRQRRFLYVCLCQEHKISTTLHNRIAKRRYKYQCVECGGDLRIKKGVNQN